MTVEVEVGRVVVVVDNLESDGSCFSGEVVPCGEDNGNIDGIAVERVVAAVIVKFVGSIVVMSKGGTPVLLDTIEVGVIGVKMVAFKPVV